MKNYIEYLRHIKQECDFIAKSTAGAAFSDFETDETLERAVVRSLEIIGEAV